MSKNFHETIRLQSEKREEWIREIKRERLQGIAESTSSANNLVNSSTASFPRRNECPGTHCSLIEQEKREDSSARSAREIEVKGKMWERAGWRGQSEKRGEVANLLLLPRPEKSLQIGAGFRKKRGVPGITVILGKANSHFDPTQTGSGTAPPL